jgi:Lon protease-like protein
VNTFDLPFGGLPVSLAVFPLTGVLLLPRGRLPLNIFEPRYLAMISDAMGDTRLIGMLQPTDPASQDVNPSVYQTGCAGRIVNFEEADDGRFLITLLGCNRFKIRDELPLKHGYRSVIADWSPYRRDLEQPEPSEIDRARLLTGLRGYFEIHGIRVDWENVEEADDERLINMVAMVCPFEPPEKQALLEAEDLSARAKTLIALVEMAVLSTAGDDNAKQ